ncbi:MAG: twin-arginine translocation signal domain-containing protein, partial [Planctomycetota bacterium]
MTVKNNLSRRRFLTKAAGAAAGAVALPYFVPASVLAGAS